MRSPCIDPSTGLPVTGKRRGFFPRDTRGCVLWLRANVGVTVATGVSRWRDLSGKGNDAVQATGANQPAVATGAASFNGKTAIDFTGASSHSLTISAAGLGLTGPFTIIMAAKTTAAAADACVFAQGIGANAVAITHHNNANMFLYINSGANSVGVAKSGSTPDVMRAQWDGTGGGAATQTITKNNGTVQSVVSSFSGALTTATDWSIGAGAVGTAAWTGQIAELAVYNRVLSLLECVRIERNMGLRYAIALAA